MRLIRILLIIVFVVSLAPMTVQAQTATPPAAVRLALDAMTPEEKVGQLFLVTFSGTDIGQDSQIYDLIVRQHIGGVVLLSEKDNFKDTDTVREAYSLISGLQQLEWAYLRQFLIRL